MTCVNWNRHRRRFLRSQPVTGTTRVRFGDVPVIGDRSGLQIVFPSPAISGTKPRVFRGDLRRINNRRLGASRPTAECGFLEWI
jgi:hypothetical protein